MLVVIPSELYGRVGAVLSALIVAACVIGLTMHKDFYAGIVRRDFCCFYTNLSNLLVLIYFALLAPRLYADGRLRPMIPHAEFSVMMSIMLTFCVFHLLLYPAIRGAVAAAERTREFQIVCTDNFIIHYLVPWLVFAYWLLCSPDKSALTLSDAFLWTGVPMVYLVYIFLRVRAGKHIEETDSPYPYPFLDASVLGRRTVARTCLLLYGICIAAGIAVILATRFFLAALGSGHALMLI